MNSDRRFLCAPLSAGYASRYTKEHKTKFDYLFIGIIYPKFEKAIAEELNQATEGLNEIIA